MADKKNILENDISLILNSDKEVTRYSHGNTIKEIKKNAKGI